MAVAQSSGRSDGCTHMRAHERKRTQGLHCHSLLQDYYRGVCSDVMEGGMAPPRAYRGDYEGGYGGGSYSRGGGVASSSGIPADAEGSTILKLRGLPFSVSDEDICNWFNDDTTLGISPVIKDKWVWDWHCNAPLRSSWNCSFEPWHEQSGPKADGPFWHANHCPPSAPWHVQSQAECQMPSPSHFDEHETCQSVCFLTRLPCFWKVFCVALLLGLR